MEGKKKPLKKGQFFIEIKTARMVRYDRTNLSGEICFHTLIGGRKECVSKEKWKIDFINFWAWARKQKKTIAALALLFLVVILAILL